MGLEASAVLLAWTFFVVAILRAFWRVLDQNLLESSSLELNSYEHHAEWDEEQERLAEDFLGLLGLLFLDRFQSKLTDHSKNGKRHEAEEHHVSHEVIELEFVFRDCF